MPNGTQYIYISLYIRGSSRPEQQGKLGDRWRDVRLFHGSKIGSESRCPPAAAVMKNGMKQALNMSQKSSKIGPASVLRLKRSTSSWINYSQHQTHFVSSRHLCFVGSQAIRHTRRTGAYTATSRRQGNIGFFMISGFE